MKDCIGVIAWTNAKMHLARLCMRMSCHGVKRKRSQSYVLRESTSRITYQSYQRREQAQYEAPDYSPRESGSSSPLFLVRS